MRDHTQDNVAISPGDPLVPLPTLIVPTTFKDWLGKFEYWYRTDRIKEPSEYRLLYLPIEVTRDPELLPLSRAYFDVICEVCKQRLYRASAHPDQVVAHHLSRAYDRLSAHTVAHPECLRYRIILGSR